MPFGATRSSAKGLRTPGYRRTGRRLTYWSSANRSLSRRPRSRTPLGTPGSPTAPSRIASWPRISARTESGRVSPVASQRRAPRSYAVVLTLTPLDSVTAERTLSASATTSGPMPSPPMTAMFTTSVFCMSAMFTSVGAVLHCGFLISRYEQHPWQTAPGSSPTPQFNRLANLRVRVALVSQVERLLQRAARSQYVFAHTNHVLPQQCLLVYACEVTS